MRPVGIPTRSCRSPTSLRISPPCSGAPPSMPPLALLAPFSPRSTSGGGARRKTKPGHAKRGRRSGHFGSGHPFPRVHGGVAEAARLPAPAECHIVNYVTFYEYIMALEN